MPKRMKYYGVLSTINPLPIARSYSLLGKTMF
jgi:hypothetical protein